MGDPFRMEKINTCFILMLFSMNHNHSFLFVPFKYHLQLAKKIIIGFSEVIFYSKLKFPTEKKYYVTYVNQK